MRTQSHDRESIPEWPNRLGIEGIEFAELRADDVVRHRIVMDIVEASRRHGERAGG